MPQSFAGRQSWKEKTLAADMIWSQVEQILKIKGLALPATPRRPDVRIILNNISGMTQMFKNPGNHSDKAETIPASGEKTAAMIMIKGETLTEQFNNARALVERYNLAEEGLSNAFVRALQSGETLDLVSEAYGPAPFEGQAKKLVPVEWSNSGGTKETITPVQGAACAYGARAATAEMAFFVDLGFSVHGSGTSPENMESGMVVAVSQDWETKAVSTRPIVPSVARVFYGAHLATMPVVNIATDGFVENIDLQDGRTLTFKPDYELITTSKAKIG